jgi:hypothetical protein
MISLKLSSTLFLPALLALVPLSSNPNGHDYVFATIDPPFGTPGIEMSIGWLTLDDRGVMTAQFQSPIGPAPELDLHTAIFQDGRWRLIDVPGAVSTGTTNANNRGEVMLTYLDPGDPVPHVASYRSGVFTRLPDLGGYPFGRICNAMNSQGAVVGEVADTAGWHAYVLDGAGLSVFDYPAVGVTSTNAVGINDAGTIVGTYVQYGALHAFRRDRDGIASIDVPGASQTVAGGINNRGWIVGAYESNGLFLGYVLVDGRRTDLRVGTALATIPVTINDSGDIAGYYIDDIGVPHGFIARRRVDQKGV